jgi:hypothetical protein
MNGETPRGWTKEQMWAIWQGFTAGLSMYQVNITTDSNVYKAAGVRNSGKVVMYSETGRSFSPVNAFGTTRFATVYRKSTPQYNAGTLIHEVGHLLGLSHDGSPTAEYFPGFSAFQWCPVMGSHVSALSWTNTLWQWSKGQYLNANQKQDDLALINRHLPFREDDITLATPLQLQGTLIPAGLNWGQISAANDSDTFSFQLASGGGRVRLKIDRIEYARGSMLDVDATLRDAAGKTVARNNKAGMRYAEFDLTLAAGKYSLTLKGGAEGTPSNGFSNYSSLGYYGITGEISGATVEIAATRNDDGAFRVKTVSAGSRLALDFPGGAEVSDIGLHSVTGASVFSSSTRVESIDISGVRPGIYVFNVTVGGRNLTRRLAL